MQSCCTGRSGAQANLADAEDAATAVWAVIERARSKADRAGGYIDATEDAGAIIARACAVADFVL